MGTPVCSRIFVYGSLRKGFNHPAYKYIRDYFHFLAAAKVKGLLFDFGDFPAAIPTDTEDFIRGELYELNHEDEFGWAMAQLDDYEGVSPEPGEVSLYHRVATNAFTETEVYDAWVYWYNGPVGDAPRIISGDVLQYTQEKYR